MSLTRINEFEAAEGKADELFDFLKSLVPYISSSSGCLLIEVLRSQDNQSKFAVIEKWESEEAHQQCLANYPKEDMQAAMPLFGGPPKGGFYHE
ncbi:antibiotic biosynthesis monooxygenase [Alteromonadaceae bacterium M269]|nr:antibiotic biosynthesis monooxygenase [Alteromonadaceae bacterium M269]